MTRALSRENWIGVAVTGLAVAAMAVDWRLALAAVILGALVLALGTIGYAVQFVDKL